MLSSRTIVYTHYHNCRGRDIEKGRIQDRRGKDYCRPDLAEQPLSWDGVGGIALSTRELASAGREGLEWRNV